MVNTHRSARTQSLIVHLLLYEVRLYQLLPISTSRTTVMAIQTRSSTSLPHRRLTRSSPSHLKAAELAATRNRASAVAQRLRNNELASLQLTKPKLQRRSLQVVKPKLQRPSVKVAKVAKVISKAGKVTKRKGNESGIRYEGPGYSAKAKRAKHPSYKECVICADSKEL